MRSVAGVQRARELRAAADTLDPPALPRPVPAPDLTFTTSEVRHLAKWYRPRHTIYGDTPATQWANLTQLALDSRRRNPRRHR